MIRFSTHCSSKAVPPGKSGIRRHVNRQGSRPINPPFPTLQKNISFCRRVALYYRCDPISMYLGVRNLRRFFHISCAALLLLTLAAPSLQAQVLPLGIQLDSDVRVGFLFGSQALRQVENTAANVRYKADLDPRMPVFEVMAELSPMSRVSARFAGLISSWETSMTQTRNAAFPGAGTVFEWSVQPEFKYWEVAGLFHLVAGGGYRFSAVGGYRREFWDYAGDPSGPSGSPTAGSFLRDRFDSSIPFIGLQTSMAFPWWKARFEILGSPFMFRDITVLANDGANTVEYRGRLDNGGLIELSFEGTAQVASSCRLGLYCRYRYQELYGELTGTNSNAALRRFDAYMGENLAVFGLNANLFF
jgi:hypothetical protein